MGNRFELSGTFHDGTLNIVDKRHRDKPADKMREHFLFGLTPKDRLELAKLLLKSIVRQPEQPSPFAVPLPTDPVSPYHWQDCQRSDDRS